MTVQSNEQTGTDTSTTVQLTPVAAVKVPATGVADGVLLFANYLTPGPHSAVLPRSGTVPVTFGPNDFQVPSKQAGSAGK